MLFVQNEVIVIYIQMKYKKNEFFYLIKKISIQLDLITSCIYITMLQEPNQSNRFDRVNYKPKINTFNHITLIGK